MLKVMESFGVYDCAAVVTRYFGGILLGTGGLQRAYSGAVELALEKADIITMQLQRRTVIECSYDFYGRLVSMIEASGGTITDTDFTETVKIGACVPEDMTGSFIKEVYSTSAGKISPEFFEYTYIERKL